MRFACPMESWSHGVTLQKDDAQYQNSRRLPGPRPLSDEGGRGRTGETTEACGILRHLTGRWPAAKAFHWRESSPYTMQGSRTGRAAMGETMQGMRSLGAGQRSKGREGRARTGSRGCDRVASRTKPKTSRDRDRDLSPEAMTSPSMRTRPKTAIPPRGYERKDKMAARGWPEGQLGRAWRPRR